MPTIATYPLLHGDFNTFTDLSMPAAGEPSVSTAGKPSMFTAAWWAYIAYVYCYMVSHQHTTACCLMIAYPLPVAQLYTRVLVSPDLSKCSVAQLTPEYWWAQISPSVIQLKWLSLTLVSPVIRWVLIGTQPIPCDAFRCISLMPVAANSRSVHLQFECFNFCSM